MRRILKAVGGYISLGAVCALLGGCAFTHKNAELIQRYKNPATEFRLHTATPLGGTLARSGDQYVLAITNFMTSEKALELTFPAAPQPKKVATATARVVEIVALQDGKRVEIEQMDGRYDHTAQIDDKMRYANNAPTRLTIGVYWDIRSTGYDHVEYTVGYKYRPDEWFVTARATSSLDWMCRSHMTLAGYYARYLYTVPLDVVTSPIQLIGIWLTPKWE